MARMAYRCGRNYEFVVKNSLLSKNKQKITTKLKPKVLQFIKFIHNGAISTIEGFINTGMIVANIINTDNAKPI